MNETKFCPDCGNELEVNEFYTLKNGGYSRCCMDCKTKEYKAIKDFLSEYRRNLVKAYTPNKA